MPILAESEPSGPVTGTDSAVRLDRPTVEVIFDGSMRRESLEVADRDPSSRGLGAAMNARRAAAAGNTPPPVAPPPAAEEAPADAPPPDASETPPDAPPADGEAPAADSPPADAPPEEKPPEPPQTAAELEQARQEAALLRGRLHGREATSLAEERAAYIRDPVSWYRNTVARVLGIDPSDKRLDDEENHLQSELTFKAIGADTLPDDRKWQRHQEHQGREKRLQQIAPDTSAGTNVAAQALASVSSAFQAAEKEHPFLAYAAHLGDFDPAQAALDLWSEAYRTGRTKATTDAEAVREALRLANDHYQTRAQRLDMLRPAATAPSSTPAPAQASAQVAAPGAPKQNTPTTPAKAGSASSTALSARQAAAAPRARAEKPDDGRIVIDPSNLDAERARRLAIVQKRRTAR